MVAAGRRSLHGEMTVSWPVNKEPTGVDCNKTRPDDLRRFDINFSQNSFLILYQRRTDRCGWMGDGRSTFLVLTVLVAAPTANFRQKFQGWATRWLHFSNDVYTALFSGLVLCKCDMTRCQSGRIKNGRGGNKEPSEEETAGSWLRNIPTDRERNTHSATREGESRLLNANEGGKIFQEYGR